jgi:2-oxoisovalerate dehydrogenase E1 component
VSQAFIPMSVSFDNLCVFWNVYSEARIASFMGHGFYTIGPCGEELMAAVGSNLRASDPSALHYRHVSMSVYRQLAAGRSIEDIALDRARGYTVSIHDPVAGGRHCAIGGTPTDFFVTSTLASQTPPAVGRALAIPLSQALLANHPSTKPRFNSDSVSFVSVGDGSVNNAHFLAGLNLARYLQHRKFKVTCFSADTIPSSHVHVRLYFVFVL